MPDSRHSAHDSPPAIREADTADFGRQILDRIDRLASCSSDPPALTRIFLSPEQRQASGLVLAWMRQAGMQVRVDEIGNVIGRYEGNRPGLPALLMGSHLDTVRDAGKFDGMLGVVTAISCVERLNRVGRRYPFAIEVIGFADEEGVRFGATMLGSRAVAGTFDPKLLEVRDSNGITLSDALRDYGLDPTAVGGAARQAREILGYVELHIEQGPVLEAHGLPAGVVTSINGATRLLVTLKGTAGHAGTVPMAQRQDALVAGARIALAVEGRCKSEEWLVGTVGRFEVKPGAINVIPGFAQLSIDVRSPDNGQRERAVRDIVDGIRRIGGDSGVEASIEKIYEFNATPCASWLTAQIEQSIAAEGIRPHRLPSGAGHDGMAMSALTDIAMIFVRCAGGISHHPKESISVEDAAIGASVLCRFIDNFAPQGPR